MTLPRMGFRCPCALCQGKYSTQAGGLGRGGAVGYKRWGSENGEEGWAVGTLGRQILGSKEDTLALVPLNVEKQPCPSAREETHPQNQLRQGTYRYLHPNHHTDTLARHPNM